ncbi:hypothetical protein Megpolyxen_01447 [Candidatus Megaera polyxenophila]|nr:hypothetical protein Megpolyxen_01447 [Candidatus Megaera polyxenophila]
MKEKLSQHLPNMVTREICIRTFVIFEMRNRVDKYALPKGKGIIEIRMVESDLMFLNILGGKQAPNLNMKL